MKAKKKIIHDAITVMMNFNTTKKMDIITQESVQVMALDVQTTL